MHFAHRGIVPDFFLPQFDEKKQIYTHILNRTD